MANKMALEQKIDAILARLDQSATKDDLKVFATKDDLKDFATKDDLTDFRTSVETRFDRVDSRLTKVEVRLDEVKSIANLGLEGIKGLDQSMERRFDEADRKHDEQIDLLKKVSVHIRTRVQRLENQRPPRRGRG